MENIQVTNPELWCRLVRSNAKDPYSWAVMSYAIRWAELMEGAMKEGEKLENVALDTSKIADEELGNNGPTLLMYGMAVKVLADVWKWGEELRVWNNRRVSEMLGRPYVMDRGVAQPAIVQTPAGQTSVIAAYFDYANMQPEQFQGLIRKAVMETVLRNGKQN